MVSGEMTGSDLWIKKNIQSDVWRTDGVGRGGSGEGEVSRGQRGQREAIAVVHVRDHRRLV